MEKTEVFVAYGHRLVKSTHSTTFEITKEKNLTKKGNCIIAVNSDKTLADLSKEFKEMARKPNSEIKITIVVGEEKEIIKAHGDPRLTFSHPTDIVVRRSLFVCNRTLAVKANKAAIHLQRRLVNKLRNPKEKVKITLTVEVPD